MRNKQDREECYALCHIFGVKFRLITIPDGARMRHYIHHLYTLGESGGLLRQITIEDCNPAAWRAAIKRLLRTDPQELW